MRHCTLDDTYKLFRLDQHTRQPSPRLLEFYDFNPIERFRRMVDKVASHVETTGSIKTFEAIADRMFGKPIPIEPSVGQGDDRLFAMLDAIAERRKAAQAQLNANRETESAQWHTIDVEPVDAGQ